MYRNIELLCCTTGTNSVIGQSYSKNKLIEKEIRFVVTRHGGEGEGQLEEAQTSSGKKYKLPVISTGDVVYMINVINTVLCYI